jgi:hypothetical protein
MAEPKLRIPRRTVFDNPMNTLISALKMQAENPNTIKSLNADMSLRRVMGFPLPPWQREREWSDEQMARFITSVYSGVHLGVFVYNQNFFKPKLNGLLVDGQQRLFSIETYLAGELAVKGEDGIARTWKELTEDEQSHFLRMTFGFSIVECEEEQELVDLYNLMAFGGTPHRQDQRASLG